MDKKNFSLRIGISYDMYENIKERCNDLSINISDYVRLLIDLDIGSYELEFVSNNRNKLINEIDSIKTKLKYF